MRGAFARTAVAVAAVCAVVLAAQGVSAGTLYLTDQLLAESDVGDCPFFPTFAAQPDLPADGKAYLGTSYGFLACPNHFTWTAGSATTLGDITFTFFFGCDLPSFSGTGGAVPDFLYRLHIGEDTVYDDFQGNGPPVCAPGDVVELVASIPTGNAEVAAGTAVTLEIVPFYTNPTLGEADNLYIGTGAATPSRMVASGLPEGAAPSGSTTVYEDLTDEGFSHSFANPQNNTWQYNWTTQKGDHRVILEANVTAGAAAITVRDAASDAVYEQTVDATTQAVGDIRGGEPGNWTITVTYTGFVGSLDFGIAEGAVGGGGGTTGTSTGTSTGTRGPTATVSPTTGSQNGTQDDGEEGSPGVGFVAAVAALGALAVVARRRLA